MTARYAIAMTVFSGAVLAQPGNVTRDAPFQTAYVANLNIGDSILYITNTGARGAGLSSGTSASITGSICVNVYASDPGEQMIECCVCPVTPNGLVLISVNRDLLSNAFTPVVPTSVVIKLLATAPVNGACSYATTTTPLSAGLAAFRTTLHAMPGGAYATTEVPFVPATLSQGELQRLESLCTFMRANGSGYGVCSCPFRGPY